MSNVYYDPAEFGLVIVDVLDEGGLSYEYNTLIVLKHTATGRVFYAQDSGCSCPTPFENYNFSFEDGQIRTDLTEINVVSLANFERDVEGFPVSMSERQACLVKVKEALKVVDAN